MQKYPKIKPNWRIQITAKNWLVFGVPPALNVMATAFSMASVQISQHFRKKKWQPRKFGHFMASGCSQTHFCAFSMIWATFCTHQTTAICVCFSVASPKVLTLSKIWRGRCTLSASLSKWEGHIGRLECGQLRLLTGVKGRKFETSSTKDTRDIHERSGQHLWG